MLALTVVPCTDAVSLSADAHEHHEEHDHGSEADDCSPLCQCQCCHINVTLPSPLSIASPVESVHFQLLEYFESVSETFSPTQFKPPIA